jgi:hypothetical protein
VVQSVRGLAIKRLQNQRVCSLARATRVRVSHIDSSQKQPALGTPTLGGPLATSGGLVLISAAMDDYLRAFDAKTGAELWTGRLPATGNATPTTYEWQGRQYVVIAAGGHGETGSPANDALVAFALPRSGESPPSPWISWIDKPGGRFQLHAGMCCLRPGCGGSPVVPLASRGTSPACASRAVAQIATLVAVDKHSGRFIGEGGLHWGAI